MNKIRLSFFVSLLLTSSLWAADSSEKTSLHALRGMATELSSALTNLEKLFQSVATKSNKYNRIDEIENSLERAKKYIEDANTDSVGSRTFDNAKEKLKNYVSWQQLRPIDKDLRYLLKIILAEQIKLVASNEALFSEDDFSTWAKNFLSYSLIKNPKKEEIATMISRVKEVMKGYVLEPSRNSYYAIDSLRKTGNEIKEKRYENKKSKEKGAQDVLNVKMPTEHVRRGGQRLSNRDELNSYGMPLPLTDELFTKVHKLINTMLPELYRNGDIYEPTSQERRELASLFTHLRSLSNKITEEEYLKDDVITLEVRRRYETDEIYNIVGTHFTWSRYHESCKSTNLDFTIKIDDLCAAFREVFGTYATRHGNLS